MACASASLSCGAIPEPRLEPLDLFERVGSSTPRTTSTIFLAADCGPRDFRCCLPVVLRLADVIRPQRRGLRLVAGDVPRLVLRASRAWVGIHAAHQKKLGRLVARTRGPEDNDRGSWIVEQGLLNQVKVLLNDVWNFLVPTGVLVQPHDEHAAISKEAGIPF